MVVNSFLRAAHRLMRRTLSEGAAGRGSPAQPSYPSLPALGAPPHLERFRVQVDLLPRMLATYGELLGPVLVHRIADRLAQAALPAVGRYATLPATAWDPLAKAAHRAADEVMAALPGALGRFPHALFEGPVTRERLGAAWSLPALQREAVLDTRSRSALVNKVWAEHGGALEMNGAIPEAQWPAVAFDLAALVDQSKAFHAGAFSIHMARLPRTIATFELPPAVSVEGLQEAVSADAREGSRFD